MPAHLPPAARALAAAVHDTVQSAAARDRDAFAHAAARLATHDEEQVRGLLGAVVRSLLEEAHPDGLDAQEVQDALAGCVRAALTWLPDVDTAALVVVVTGALGVHDPEQVERPVTAADVAVSAPLLVAHLLTTAPRPLGAHLADALGEIARAETVELP